MDWGNERDIHKSTLRLERFKERKNEKDIKKKRSMDEISRKGIWRKRHRGRSVI